MHKFIFAVCLTIGIASPALAGGRDAAPTALQDFIGQYDLSDGGLLSVTASGRGLVIQVDGAAPSKAERIGPSTFRAGKFELRFDQRSNGNVVSVTVVEKR